MVSRQLENQVIRQLYTWMIDNSGNLHWQLKVANLDFFLFLTIYLLYTGNLKHKDLTGQVVSSQAYVDNQNDDVNDDPAGAIDENESASVASEDR